MKAGLELTKFRKRKVKLSISTYYLSGNLAIEMMYYNNEPYSTITVNLGKCGVNKAFIDTNSCGDEIIDWLIENKLGELTGEARSSGYYEYPEFLFYQDCLLKIDKDGYSEYLDGIGNQVLTGRCNVCGHSFLFVVTKEVYDKYEAYLEGAPYLIQDIFPDMSAFDRALFARGQNLCKTCWKDMFGVFG